MHNRRLDKKEKTLGDHMRVLEGFNVRAAKIRFDIIPGSSLDLVVNSIDSLDRLRIELGGLIAKIDFEAKLCAQAMDVFDVLLREEQEQLRELLSKGSEALNVFRAITGGSYVDLRYDPKTKSMTAIDTEGRSFTPNDLSKATRDQLYLSVRIALGERLLGGRQGLFIMDDPFIASDLDRISTQTELIRRVVDRGWQVILLTAREDLAKSLSDTLNTPLLKLRPLRSRQRKAKD